MSDHRIGMIVPSSNLTMETELPRMMRDRERALPGERFTFHSSRMRMKHVTPEELARMNAQTERASLELADARPDVVASACLVAIMAQGPGHHCHAEAQIAGVLQGEGLDVPVVSSAGALLRALDAMGARRIAMVTPYMKPLTRLVADYIEDAGDVLEAVVHGKTALPGDGDVLVDTYVLAGAEKLGAASPFAVLPLSAVAGIVTDAPAGDEVVERLVRRGVTNNPAGRR